MSPWWSNIPPDLFEILFRWIFSFWWFYDFQNHLKIHVDFTFHYIITILFVRYFGFPLFSSSYIVITFSTPSKKCGEREFYKKRDFYQNEKWCLLWKIYKFLLYRKEETFVYFVAGINCRHYFWNLNILNDTVNRHHQVFFLFFWNRYLLKF